MFKWGSLDILVLNLLWFFREMKIFNLPGCSWMFAIFEFRTNNLLDTQPGRASQRAVKSMNHKGSLFSRMDSQIGDFCQITCQATCSQSRSSEEAPVQSSVQWEQKTPAGVAGPMAYASMFTASTTKFGNCLELIGRSQAKGNSSSQSCHDPLNQPIKNPRFPGVFRSHSFPL